MDQTNNVDHRRQLADGPRQPADGRREALSWLARRLNWERRLGELRPTATKTAEIAETKQAA